MSKRTKKNSTLAPFPPLSPLFASKTNPLQIYDYYGDIAISAAGILYSSTSSGDNGTSNGAFYRFPMSALPANSGPATAPAVVIRGGGTNTAFSSQQLSFDCAGQVLWAQSYSTGTWATIDLSTGSRTRVFTLLIPGTGT